jgi:hypothetical protein
MFPERRRSFLAALAIHPDEVPSGRNEEDGIALADPDAVREPIFNFIKSKMCALVEAANGDLVYLRLHRSAKETNPRPARVSK